MLTTARALAVSALCLLALVATSASAKAKLRTIDLPGVHAKAQVPTSWQVKDHNAAVKQLIRPGRDSVMYLQLIDASSAKAAPQELMLTMAPLPLTAEQFRAIDDETLPGALVFSGEAPGAGGGVVKFYGLVRTSPFGGGAAVWVMGADVGEPDWRDVAGIARRLSFREHPKAQGPKSFTLVSPGLGYAIDIPAEGFALKQAGEEQISLVALQPARAFDVKLLTGLNAVEPERVLREAMKTWGVANPHITPLSDGAVSRLSAPVDGQPYEHITFVRAVPQGGMIVGSYGVRFAMSEADQRRALELILTIKAVPEPKSKAASAAEAGLGGLYLFRGGGGSSDSMGWTASSSTEQNWHICSDRSYAYHYQSVFSLGEFGGSVESDDHSGRWAVADGNGGSLFLVLHKSTGERLLLPLTIARDGINIDGTSYRFERSGRCR